MSVNITHRYDAGHVIYSAEIPGSTPPHRRMAVAVGTAIRAGANLSGADLSGADLSRATLSGANLYGANLSGAIWREGVKLKRGIVKEASRSDGYLFRLLDCVCGWRVAAGCRFFTLDEAWRHWGHGPRANTSLGEESEDILILFEHHIERLAREGG